MRTWTRIWATGAMVALGACVEADDAEALAAAEDAELEDEDVEDEDVEARSNCFYLSPPGAEVAAGLVGPPTIVNSGFGTSSGGCDLFTFHVTAAPPTDRARKVKFVATSFGDPPTDYDAVVWRLPSCTTPPCHLAPGSKVPLTVDRDIICSHGLCLPGPWQAKGELALSATNGYTLVVAGMRAFTADGDAISVSMSVEE